MNDPLRKLFKHYTVYHTMKDFQTKIEEIVEQSKTELSRELELFDSGIDKLVHAPDMLQKRPRLIKDKTIYFADFKTKDGVDDHTVQYFRKKLNARRLRLYYWFTQPSIVEVGYQHFTICFYSIA